MPFTIAVLADLHLPDIAGAAQYAVFDWALDTLRQDPPDLILLAGDMTAMGTVKAATHVSTQIDALGIPYRSIPGNAEVRTPADSQACCDLLTEAAPYHHEQMTILSLANPTGAFTEPERAQLLADIAQAKGRQVIVMSHYPLNTVDYDWLQPALESGAITIHLSGHSHIDVDELRGATQVQQVRGLDPDKAKGPAPAIVTLEYDNGSWTRTELGFPGCDVSLWTQDERDEFRQYLGLSCMAVTLEGLALAKEQGVQCVELRAEPALGEDRMQLYAAVSAWRELGETTLSIHMPELRWHQGNIKGQATWEAARDLAMALNAQSLTIHPPRTTVEDMQPGSPIRQAFCDFMTQTLAPAIQAGMTLSIENLHTSDNEPPGDQRRFGCLPHETLGWIETLREACPTADIGQHLDTGHVRSNPPFSSPYPLGTWYAMVGHEISGFHIHRVGHPDGRPGNHFPITEVYGALISYLSFLWAWQTRQFNHAPIYIEVRGGLEAIETSLKALRDYVG